MGYRNHGFNASFSANGLSTIKAVCISISHGVEIIAAEDDSAFHRGFYPQATSTSDFSIGLVFANFTLYTEFGAWMSAYGGKAARGFIDGFVTVSVPGRDFYRRAIPTSGMTFGREVKDVVYAMTIAFIGGYEAGERNTFQSSQYVAPVVDAVHGAYISPGGTQLAGVAQGADYASNFPPVDVSNPDDIPAPSSGAHTGTVRPV